ncbi:MAG TPA: sensor histidine kinase [Vicinamibacterales bacterium]|jgi:signal transduction histidine kinase|nr:sensor histidine kinase [Vicinamibacterales bacterium]
MSLRTRLLLAFAAVVLIPIALLAFGIRQEMSRRLSAEYQRRVDGVVEVIREDLARESAGIAERLASLERALVNDNLFRLAAVAGAETQRDYLLDYAGTAMRLTGLSMLQIQDGDDRIISSGHFRNEHGRIESGLVAALQGARGVTLVTVRGPEQEFLALARVQTFALGGRTFALVGGVAIDQAFLARLARDRAIVVSLYNPGAEPLTLPRPPEAARDSAVGALQLPVIRAGSGPPLDVVQARLEVTQPLTPLRALLRSADSWFLLTAAGTGLTALLLAVWVSSRISGRLEALAEKTAVLDLDRLDVEFDPGTDEVGRLSRLLGDLVARLRTSTVRVREAERRATVGELARQINHDVKNGLIPLRNVMRHLAQVERDDPGALGAVFAERRHTVDSSLAYLETLATTYQRLSPPVSRAECDLNAVVADVVRAAQGHEHVAVDTDLVPLPRVVGDPIAFRRILENLIANAVDSVPSAGRIVVSTRVVDRDGDLPAIQLAVADSGRGMSADEAGRIFEDFYTTKEGGTGLGLSIVRRLVTDLHGTIAVDTAPGRGTRITIDIPAGGLPPAARRV